MSLDTSTLWQTVEWTETVSFYSRTSESTFAAVQTVEYAKRRSPTKDEMSGGGGLFSTVDLVWHVWTSKLGGIVPKIGDVVRDSSAIRWTVVKVEIQSLIQRFRLSCAKEK